METILLRELEAATGAKLLGDFQDPQTRITGCTSDNRKVQPGDVFFAFTGEKTDGHRFVRAALEAGACGCVISEKPDEYVPGKFYCLVEDTIAAYGDLARYYRNMFSIPVIAVTGSVGKTTTKDMIASVLAQHYRVLKTEGNFNNHIGLPTTLLRMDSTTQIAVVEMGMNHPGEIDYLTRIARPTAVTITNIGDAHIGNLGSRENIFKAKCEIFNGLCRDGLAVLNGDDEFLPSLQYNEEIAQFCRLVYAGSGEGCDFRAVPADGGESGAPAEGQGADAGVQAMDKEGMDCIITMPEGTLKVHIPVPGAHMVYPAATAAAFGACFGLTSEEIARGIENYVPTRMRMETVRCPKQITILNDTYNANPQSMKSGLTTLSGMTGGKKVAVVGDMFELGDEEERLHRETGEYAGTLPLDVLVTVGSAAKYIAEGAASVNGAMKIFACPDKEAARDVLRGLIEPETIFLCKASRGMALEELVGFIREAAEKL